MSKKILANFALVPNSNDRTIFIKQFQELLLTSNNLELEISEELIKIYENLNTFNEKFSFINDFQKAITFPTVLENLSSINHKFLMENALKLCISVLIRRLNLCYIMLIGKHSTRNYSSY